MLTIEQFGDERLLSILRNTHFDTAQQVIETLAADVETHRNGAEPNDDLTMLCLRVSGLPGDRYLADTKLRIYL